MIQRRVMVILNLLFTCAVWSLSNPIPKELFFLGKPADPLCFSDLESHSNIIDLKNCGLAKEKLTLKRQNISLLRKGFFGFDWKNTEDSYPSEGYSYYKIFPLGYYQYWIYTLNNRGGSGDFTAIKILTVKKEGQLLINTLVGGDRCNGGIQDVKEKNHHLLFSVNITAYDFLTLTQDNPHHLKAYDDLAACATCCAAKAFYDVDSTLKPQLKGVDLGDHANNLAEMSSQGRYQDCFNTLLASYVKRGDSRLNSLRLNQLINQFNQTCVK